jgi:hypothetical protein
MKPSLAKALLWRIATSVTSQNWEEKKNRDLNWTLIVWPNLML